MRSALIVLALCVLPARAGGVLVGRHLAVGVHPDGSLCDAAERVCIAYDPDGASQGVPLGGDLLLPGRAFEAWGARWVAGGEVRRIAASGPDRDDGPVLAWDPPARTGGFVHLEGSGSAGDLDVSVVVDVPVDGHVLHTTLTLTARVPITGLEVVRTVDVDPDHFATGSFGAVNEAMGAVATSASTRTPGRALALAVADGTAGLCPRDSWCRHPEIVREGGSGPTTDDRVIGVVAPAVDLEAGGSLVVRFVHALGTDAELARSRALDAVAVWDLDGDGFGPEDGDCEDRDAAVHPGAPERPDGGDDDCDGEIDEGTWAFDDDGDGWTEAEGDCDDADPDIHPGASPIEGVADADCDGLADEDPFETPGPPVGWGVGDPAPDIEPVAGGCRVSATPVLGLGVLPALLLLRRRRCVP